LKAKDQKIYLTIANICETTKLVVVNYFFKRSIYFYYFMLLQIKKSFLKVITILAFASLLFIPITANAFVPAPTTTPNIVGVASSSTDFSTLVTAVKAAGLVDTLNGVGPFTVFAPNNDAFNKLPAGLLEKLVMPENKTALTKILTYHVVAGKNDAAAVTKLDGKTVATVNGNVIKIKINNGAVLLNDKVNVTKVDLAASNGVIHVIDQVLVPADLDLSTLVSKTTTVAKPPMDNTVRSGGTSSTFITTFVIFVMLALSLRLTLRSNKQF
jgi:uncharacterized surface protein with fasciclin (FAS1) repeats